MNPVEVNKNPKQEKSGSHCIKKKAYLPAIHSFQNKHIFLFQSMHIMCINLCVQKSNVQTSVFKCVYYIIINNGTSFHM